MLQNLSSSEVSNLAEDTFREHTTLKFEGLVIQHFKTNGYDFKHIFTNPFGFQSFVINIADQIAIGDPNYNLLIDKSHFLFSGNENKIEVAHIEKSFKKTELFFISLANRGFGGLTSNFQEGLPTPFSTATIDHLFDFCENHLIYEFGNEALNNRVMNILNMLKVSQPFLVSPSVCASTVEKMYLVRKLIIENLRTEVSLAAIAKTLGTNENYLKKHFKSVFGQTIFSFINGYKMQMGKKMIENEKLPVSVVAEELGFKNPSNFSSSFRKYYGYLPKILKSRKISLVFFAQQFTMLVQECSLAISFV